MYTEIFIAFGAFLFWRTQAYLVIKNVIATNFNNFKDVKSLVSSSSNKKKNILFFGLV